MSLIRRAAAPLLERRGADPTAPWGDSTPPTNGSLGGAVAGTVVSEATALQVTAVYGSVGVIADSVSTLPVDLMDSPHRRSGNVLPPSQLLKDPFIEISPEDWWTQFTTSMALRGNFFGQIVERDKNLYATQIKPQHPDHVVVRRLPNGAVEYRFGGKVVAPDDVFHVRNLSVPEALVGLNPVEYLRNVLGPARAMDLYGGAFFQNSALPLGTIETEEELDDDETLALAKAWLAAHQGIGQSHLPAVLTAGAKFNPISITPRDAQFLEAKQYSASVISGQIFRVPPHMIGIVDRTTSWGVGIEQQEMGFVRNTLLAYIVKGERALSKLHPPGQFVKFDLTERLRGDRLQRAQAQTLGIANGSLLPDEARAEEDRPPLPDGIGQTALAPINATTLAALASQSVADNQPPPVDTAPQDQVQDRAHILEEFRDMLLAERRQAVTIHNHQEAAEAPIVNVAPTEVRNDFTVPAPTVNVAAPEVRVEAPNVTVEAQPAPVVNVEAPAVTIEQAPVHIDAPVTVNVPPEAKRKRKVLRDKRGQITGVEEE